VLIIFLKGGLYGVFGTAHRHVLGTVNGGSLPKRFY